MLASVAWAITTLASKLCSSIAFSPDNSRGAAPTRLNFLTSRDFTPHPRQFPGVETHEKEGYNACSFVQVSTVRCQPAHCDFPGCFSSRSGYLRHSAETWHVSESLFTSPLTSQPSFHILSNFKDSKHLPAVSLPSHNIANWSVIFLPSFQEANGSKKKKDTAAVDKKFFIQLLRLIKIIIPGAFTPEVYTRSGLVYNPLISDLCLSPVSLKVGYLVLVAVLLVTRTYADVWLIQNGTAIEE